MNPIKVKVLPKKLSVVTYPGTGSAIWGQIVGTVANQTDLVNYIAGLGYVSSSALAPYLLASTAASTYQPIGTYATPTNTMTFTNKSGNISQWTNDSGYITSSALSPYLTSALAASTYQPLLGFTAENVANKAVDFVTANHTLYPSVLAVKAYVDNLIAGVDYKQNVDTVATTNVTLSGLQNINGVTGVVGLPILLIGQSNPAENGCYLMDTGAWVRRSDSNSGLELEYAVYTVTMGSLAGRVYRCNTSNITLGTTALVFQEWNVASYTNGSGLSLSGNTFSIANGGVTAAMLASTTGSGAVVLETSPTFVTQITTPLINGSSGILNFANVAQTSGAITSYTFTAPNHTNQTAGANIPAFRLTPGSLQKATGAVTTQHAVVIASPTYSFVGASTQTNTWTLWVNQPTAGTLATLTNRFSLGTDGNISIGGGSVYIGQTSGFSTTNYNLFGSATLSYLNAGSGGSVQVRIADAQLALFQAGITTFTALAQTADVGDTFRFTRNNNTNASATLERRTLIITPNSRTWATGNIALQREHHILSPTWAFSGSSTITNGYNFFVENPTLGANAIVTNLWAIGAAGNVLSQGSLVSSSPSGGVGYFTGAGATVTQLTSRTTGVTINNVCGSITLFSAAGTTTWQSFTVTNSRVAVGDVVIVLQRSGTDQNEIMVTNVSAGAFTVAFRTTGGTTTEQPVFTFAILKAVTA